MKNARDSLNFLIVASLALCFFIGTFTIGRAEAAYKSLHDYSASYCYCSDTPGGDYGEYPCGDSYRYCQNRTGFQYRCDLTDPKLLLQRELTESTDPTLTDFQNSPSSYKATYGFFLEDYHSLKTFSMYVPKGTKRVTVILFCHRDREVAAVARFGSQPQGDYSGLDYDDIEANHGERLASLKASDCLFRNTGGHMTIVDQVMSPLAGGGWLYIKVFKNSIFMAQWSNQVDVESYLSWYKTMNSGNWAAFEAAGSIEDENPGGGSSPPPSDDPDDSDYTNNPAFGYGDDDGGNYTGNDSSSSNPLLDLLNSFGENNQDQGTGDQDQGTGDQDQGSGDPDPEMSINLDATDSEIQEFSDFGGRSTLILSPSLSMENPPQGAVRCYAGFSLGEMAYLGQRDVFGNIVFVKYLLGDSLKDYGVEVLSSGGDWICGAFESLGPIPLVEELSQITFAVAIAPNGNLEELQGAMFRLVP